MLTPANNTFSILASADGAFYSIYPDGDRPVIGTGTKTLSWVKPTARADAVALTAGQITGYPLFYKKGSRWDYIGTVSGEDTVSATVPAGRWSVAAAYTGGQSALSDPADTDDWRASLPAPTAANTVTTANSRAEIQSKVNALQPGEALYFRGGTYLYTTTAAAGSADSSFITVGVSGSASGHATIMAYPGETPIIQGVGWASETNGPTGDQAGLICVSGNYVRVYGFEITASGKHAIAVDGSNAHITENYCHDNWEGGIILGSRGVAAFDHTSSVVEYNRCCYNRRSTGIAILLRDQIYQNVDDLTIRRNLCYRNGYNTGDVINIFGGGNSDGISVAKAAHDNYLPSTGDLDPAVSGRQNRVHNLHLIQNICFRNADDGFDISPGEGTKVIGNIAFKNGPSGNRGYKILRDLYENLQWLGNIALGSSANIWTDKVYVTRITAGSAAEVFVSDTITGATSGATATVTAVEIFTNGNESQSWTDSEFSAKLSISGLSGTFQVGEIITVGGVNKVQVQSGGQIMGCEHRANTNEATRDYGSNQEVAWTSLNHNQPGGGSMPGIKTELSSTLTADLMNCLSYGNQDDDSTLTYYTQTTNHLNDAGIAPGIIDAAYMDPLETISGSTIQAQWANIYYTITGQVMAASGGNLHEAGTLDTDYYHTRPCDADDNPADPADLTKLHWYVSGKTAGVPDIGASQYRFVNPPADVSIT